MLNIVNNIYIQSNPGALAIQPQRLASTATKNEMNRALGHLCAHIG